MNLLHNSKAALHKAACLAVKVAHKVARKRPLLWPVWQTLPVAGLDVLHTQQVLYNLRRALPEGEESTAVIQAWLHALQLSQVASDRLLHAVSITQRHLRFWQARLKAGSHTSFLLLSRGPSGFAADVLERLGVVWRKQQQQQQTGGGGGISASDRIEERIIALQLLSTQLTEALAAVHRAAAGLSLAACSSSSTQHNGAQQQLTAQALQQQVLAAVTACGAAQAAALEQLQPAAAQLQEQEQAVRQLSAAALHPSVNVPAPKHSSKQQQQHQQQHSTSLQGVHQQLQDLAQVLHVRGAKELTRLHSADAGAALASASQLAAELGPLVEVPQWAAMPSSLQRHWIKYTLAAGVGVYAGMFLYRNSRLAGSPNLDTWVASGAASVESALSNHIVSPLVTVRDELFRTFRDRPSIVSAAEFEADKASLMRMLEDFQQDHPHLAAATATAADVTTAASGSSSSSSSSDALDVNKGMQVVMQCYELDLKKPIRGMLAGELARTLLIQVQRLKVDTEAAMLELDQILRANELSISLVAAVPGLALTYTLLRGLWVLLLVRSPPDARREATPCRLAMAELERALAALAALQQPQTTSPTGAEQAPLWMLLQSASTSSSSTNLSSQQQQQQQVAAAEGMVLYKLFKVYREAQALYRLKDSTSRYSDWPHMSADLLSMVEPSESPAAKLELHRRMLRTYCVLQP